MNPIPAYLAERQEIEQQRTPGVWTLPAYQRPDLEPDRSGGTVQIDGDDFYCWCRDAAFIADASQHMGRMRKALEYVNAELERISQEIEPDEEQQEDVPTHAAYKADEIRSGIADILTKP